MVLLVDNYDSFVHNLAQYLGALGAKVEVHRNDSPFLHRLLEMGSLPDVEAMVISPGPGRPEEAGLSLELIKRFSGCVPILGVCLGHQAIAHAFGGKVVLAPKVMHGKTSLIRHDGRTIFEGLPNPFEATRYHSLIVDEASLPSCLEVSAWTEEGEVMGIRHKEFLVEGVQFHPESVLTEAGLDLLANFLRLSGIQTRSLRR